FAITILVNCGGTSSSLEGSVFGQSQEIVSSRARAAAAAPIDLWKTTVSWSVFFERSEIVGASDMPKRQEYEPQWMEASASSAAPIETVSPNATGRAASFTSSASALSWNCAPALARVKTLRFWILPA